MNFVEAYYSLDKFTVDNMSNNDILYLLHLFINLLIEFITFLSLLLPNSSITFSPSFAISTALSLVNAILPTPAPGLAGNPVAIGLTTFKASPSN